ncbi:DUF305 domain-containing protein [Deltaproteobacteria bacterium Smac51]|nr:DUF305 domain-containing protein [Deltaproteobacteria bacterium Smac51]
MEVNSMVYKNKITTAIVLVLFLTLCLPGLIIGQEEKGSTEAVPEKGMMHDLMRRDHMMGRHWNSGQAYSDRAYLSAMIVHHEAAVDMARKVLEKGSDHEVKKWAEDVVKAQESEIGQMREWLKDMGGVDSQAAGTMGTMMFEMSREDDSKEPDRDFVSIMIGHHAMAVEMAVEALAVSTDEKIIELSKNIIITQTNEIVEYKKWLAKMGGVVHQARSSSMADMM